MEAGGEAARRRGGDQRGQENEDDATTNPRDMVLHRSSIATGRNRDPGFHRILGAILALCTLLYAWPRTSPIGAVLLTGYLGGAVATHLRVDSPLVTHTFVSVYLGAIVWLGLMLRDRRVAALLATSQTADQSLLAEDVFND